MKAEDVLSIPLSKIKRKDRRKNLINIFNLLLRLNKKNNFNKEEDRIINNYFSVPSLLLKKINHRYKPLIEILLDNDIIDYFSMQEDNELFAISNHSQNKTLSYSTKLNQSIQYIFKIDTNDIEIEEMTYNNNWFNIINKSLKELDLDSKIFRCNYGRRIHHKISLDMNIEVEGTFIRSYKDFFNLPQHKDKYKVIDIKHSQPTLLHNLMKEKGFSCEVFFNLIEKGLDIYEYIKDNITSINDREEAKRLFQRFISKDDKSIEIKGLNKLFKGVKVFSSVINKEGYKNLNKLLQRTESKLVIDNLLNNLDIDFCVTVHDSFIIKNNEVDRVYKYLNERTKGMFIKWEIEEIKK